MPVNKSGNKVSVCEEEAEIDCRLALLYVGGSHKSNFLSIMHTQIKAEVIKTLRVEFEMMRGPLGGPCYMVCGGYETARL